MVGKIATCTAYTVAIRPPTFNCLWIDMGSSNMFVAFIWIFKLQSTFPITCNPFTLERRVHVEFYGCVILGLHIYSQGHEDLQELAEPIIEITIQSGCVNSTLF